MYLNIYPNSPKQKCRSSVSPASDANDSESLIIGSLSAIDCKGLADVADPFLLAIWVGFGSDRCNRLDCSDSSKAVLQNRNDCQMGCSRRYV